MFPINQCKYNYKIFISFSYSYRIILFFNLFNLCFQMFGSMHIKQEYGENEDKSIQNIVGPQEVIDCMVFENQNLQCSYHQLPHFWDQALQIQTCNQYSKSHSLKEDNSADSNISRNTENVSKLDT